MVTFEGEVLGEDPVAVAVVKIQANNLQLLLGNSDVPSNPVIYDRQPFEF